MSTEERLRELFRVQVGDSVTVERTVTPEMVRAYAALTGDDNPIHLDPDYAAATRFGRPVVHGMLLAGLVSAVLGTRFPGPGTIYYIQSWQFARPVHVGETIQIRLVVGHLRDDRAVLQTIISVERETRAEGAAHVVLPPAQP